MLAGLKKTVSKYLWNKAKTTTDIGNNILYQILYSIYGQNTPAWLADNFEEFINEGYMKNPHVYSVINRIADKAACVPYKIYEIKDKTAHKNYKELAKKDSVKGLLLKDAAYKEVDKVTDLHKLIDNPNPENTYTDYFKAWTVNNLITGNAYQYNVRLFDKKPYSYSYILPSSITRVVIGDASEPIKGYTVETFTIKTIPKEDVVHTKKVNPNYSGSSDFYYGMSPLRAGRVPVTNSNEAYTAAVSLIKNLGAMGIISPKDTMQALDDNEQKAMQDKFDERYGGSSKLGKKIIASQALVYQSMAQSPADLKLMEQQVRNLRDICNIYGVPSVLFNDNENSSYNNMATAYKMMWNDAVIPVMNDFKEAINKGLVKDFNKKTGANYYFEFDYTGIPELQEDLNKLSARINREWVSDLITRNEARVTTGWDKLPNGDIYYSEIQGKKTENNNN